MVKFENIFYFKFNVCKFKVRYFLVNLNSYKGKKVFFDIVF